MADNQAKNSRPATPAKPGRTDADPNRSTPAKSGLRRDFERFSKPLLLQMSLLPSWLVPAAMAALLVAGLALPSSWAGLLLAPVGLFLLWLALLSWPVTSPTGRMVRLLVSIGVLATAIARLSGAM
jgi:hypothetical protein